MDELEFLKKDWQKKEKELPKLSYETIYAMMLKKSSSSIKWIFYISLIELGFGILVGIFYHPSFEKGIPLPSIIDYVTYSSMLVTLYFIFRFYKNYKRVSTTSTVKGLLESIIKARRTVAGVLMIACIIYIYVMQQGGWNSFVANADIKDYLIIFGVSIISTVIIIGFFLGIYYLLYGILMRRLKRNYNELKKMEV